MIGGLILNADNLTGLWRHLWLKEVSQCLCVQRVGKFARTRYYFSWHFCILCNTCPDRVPRVSPRRAVVITPFMTLLRKALSGIALRPHVIE
jgi:hypothetical protein